MKKITISIICLLTAAEIFSMAPKIAKVSAGCASIGTIAFGTKALYDNQELTNQQKTALGFAGVGLATACLSKRPAMGRSMIANIALNAEKFRSPQTGKFVSGGIKTGFSIPLYSTFGLIPAFIAAGCMFIPNEYTTPQGSAFDELDIEPGIVSVRH